MKRRELLRILGMGAVSAPVVGTKEAARIMGVPLDLNQPLSGTTAGRAGFPSELGPSGGWWGSPIQIEMAARREAEDPIRLGKYDHMRSWSHGFKTSVLARELAAQRHFEAHMERDFDGKALAMLMKQLGG